MLIYAKVPKKPGGLDGTGLNALPAIAYLIQPDVLTFSDLRLAVSLDDGQSRGRTRLDPKGAFARVAMDVHPPPVRRMLFERVLPAGAPVGGAMAGRSRARAPWSGPAATASAGAACGGWP